MLSELRQRKLMRLFSKYDTSNCGAIQISNFERVAKNLAGIRGWDANAPGYNRLLNKLMYDWVHMRGEADLNRDGKLDIYEWLEYFDRRLAGGPEGYQKEIASQVTSVFEVFDTDADDRLTKEDLVEYFRAYSLPVVYIDLMFAKFDSDGDGFVTRNDYRALLEDFFFSEDAKAPGNFVYGPF